MYILFGFFIAFLYFANASLRASRIVQSALSLLCHSLRALGHRESLTLALRPGFTAVLGRTFRQGLHPASKTGFALSSGSGHSFQSRPIKCYLIRISQGRSPDLHGQMLPRILLLGWWPNPIWGGSGGSGAGSGKPSVSPPPTPPPREAKKGSNLGSKKTPKKDPFL